MNSSPQIISLSSTQGGRHHHQCFGRRRQPLSIQLTKKSLALVLRTPAGTRALRAKKASNQQVSKAIKPVMHICPNKSTSRAGLQIFLIQVPGPSIKEVQIIWMETLLVRQKPRSNLSNGRSGLLSGRVHPFKYLNPQYLNPQ